MDRNVYEACCNLITRFNIHTVSADEVLSEKVDNLVPIPFKTREELEQVAERDRRDGLYQGELMPKIDLKVLHYYATQLCLRKYPHLINRFDETSLITIGLLVEKWVKDFLLSELENIDDVNGTHQEDLEETDSNNVSSQNISIGSSQFLSKVINYEDAPANI